MEETVVRDKAVESACVVIGLMQGGQQEVRRFGHGQPIGRTSSYAKFHLFNVRFALFRLPSRLSTIFIA